MMAADVAMAVAEALWWAAAAIVLAWGAWWTLLCAVALPRPRAGVASTRDLRFTVIVPAHNEEAMLGECIDSLRAAAYPVPPDILVVADNCSDATAFVARRHGATALVRDDPAQRGKSFALEYAVRHLAARAEPPDAVVIVDADTTVSPQLFTHVAARLETGARAVQAHYTTKAATTDLSKIRSLAFRLVHWSRPLGGARLGLGAGLKGNGMAFPWDVVRDGLGGSGVTEDAAMTLDLARRGIAVAFEPRATVYGYMAPAYAEARTQDERWERGRFALVPAALAVAGRALAKGRPACAAAAIEVASPPISALVLAGAGVLLGAALGAGSLVAGATAAGSLVAYVIVGLAAARAPLREVASLRSAPRFLAHKLSVFGSIVTQRSQIEWRRTERR